MALEDSEKIFYTFFDTLGKKLGMRNFAKLVLENLDLHSGSKLEGEVPLLLDADDAKGAAKAFANYLKLAMNEVDDVTFLNDIDVKREFCGLAVFSKKWVSTGEYIFNHSDFSMYVEAKLVIDVNNPKIATLKVRTYVYY